MARGEKRKQSKGGEEEVETEEVGTERAELEGEEAESKVPPKKRKNAEAAEPDEDEDEDDVEDSEAEELVCEGEEEEEEDATKTVRHVFRPGVDQLEEGEQLDYEPGTYDLLHRAQVDWPCLSFDILKDDLGASRSTYPMTAYIVAGTQAEKREDNRIYIMKWHNLYKTSKDGKDDDEDESEEDDSDDDHEATLESRAVAHPGAVNRIRSMPQASHIVATWCDDGNVYMWNLEAHRKSLDKAGEKPPANVQPLFKCSAHKQEGYALDFNPHTTGRVLTGANDSVIFLWDPKPGGWNVMSDIPFSGHGASVEDVQWKRLGNACQHIFASCSADKSFKVWDVREQNRSKPVVNVENAHSADVNVLSWSPKVGELLATGSDDGGFKIWDTRNTGAGPMANFLWHRKPITSIDWHSTDETMLAVASDDDSVSIWDMAVEDDAEGGEKPPGAEHYPAQLMFLHMGQQQLKEIRWHPQLQGICVSTAGSGFNIFKTCNA